MLDHRYLTLEELKEFLGVNHQTIYNFRRQWGLPYIKIGTTVRYDREDVIAWMAKHRCVDAPPRRRTAGGARAGVPPQAADAV